MPRRGLGSELECLLDVLGLQLRVLTEDVIHGHSTRDHAHDRFHGESQIPDAWLNGVAAEAGTDASSITQH
jgi:hypothetical protein